MDKRSAARRRSRSLSRQRAVYARDIPPGTIFYHGTKADLAIGDLISPGFGSNFADRALKHIYFRATLEAGIWGAELAKGEISYNYGHHKAFGSDMPGVSVFAKDEQGSVFHTYSCYSRGLDMLNATYQYLDLVPKGRDESGLPYPMSWLRLRDDYET